MNHKRLERMIPLLRRVEAESLPFSMRYWKIAKPECGTTLCAIGYAAEDPWFKRQGLRLNPNSYSSEPVFKGCEGFSAVAELFEISYSQAQNLFGYERPETPAQVIARIETFIKENAS